MSNGEALPPDEEPRPNPQLEPIYDFLQSVSQRFQKDLQSSKSSELDLNSQLERALRQFEKGPFADRIAADLPYGIAMAMGGWLVDSFTGRRGTGGGTGRKAKVATVEDILQVEPVRVEVGRALVPLLTGKSPLIHKITALRRYLAQSMGVILPGVRLLDNPGLQPEEYQIFIDELPVVLGKLKMDHFLLIGPIHKLQALGLAWEPEPVYGMPSAWIHSDRKRDAEKEGCMPFDPATAMASHMTRLLRRSIYRLIGRHQTGVLLKIAEKNNAPLVKQARAQLRTGLIRQVLRRLLQEQVSIRRLPTILESMLDEADTTRDPDLLTEAARRALGRQLTLEHESPEAVFNCLELDDELTAALRERLVMTRFDLEKDLSESLRKALTKGLVTLSDLGLWPALVVESDLRLPLARWARSRFPDLVVLSFPEIEPEVALEIHGHLTLGEE